MVSFHVLADLLTDHELRHRSAGLRYGSTPPISHEPCLEAGAPVHESLVGDKPATFLKISLAKRGDLRFIKSKA